MRQCICQICVCGRHRCEHTGKRLAPFARGDGDGLPITEHKERYRPFGFQPRQKPVKPPSCAQWKGDEPAVKISTTKNDYVAFPIKRRSLMRPKVSKEPKCKMDDIFTTYQHDFVPKEGLPTSKTKVPEPRKDGTMPGTLPGKMDGLTTYNRSYTPKSTQKRDKAVAAVCTLTELGKPFTGQTETALCYQPPPYQKRETLLPNKGNLKPGGEFLDATTHKTDFTPKYQTPVRPIKKFPKWKPGQGKFESDTTHKHDYKYPMPAEKTVTCAPKPEIPKSQGPFEGKSHYKQDYQPYETTARTLPKWHPSFRPYQMPTTRFEGETTYRTDYEAPPEDVPQYEPSKPLKGNLTIPSGPMEKLTTSMRDYRKVECPVPTRSFKPDLKYQQPKEKFAGRTITCTDYTPKTTEKAQTTKKSDNIKVGNGPMDDLSMTMKDFQWLAIECPATYIKLFGKDALPQYEFDKTERGHDFFKKLKKSKIKKEAPKSKRSMVIKQCNKGLEKLAKREPSIKVSF